MRRGDHRAPLEPGGAQAPPATCQRTGAHDHGAGRGASRGVAHLRRWAHRTSGGSSAGAQAGLGGAPPAAGHPSVAGRAGRAGWRTHWTVRRHGARGPVSRRPGSGPGLGPDARVATGGGGLPDPGLPRCGRDRSTRPAQGPSRFPSPRALADLDSPRGGTREPAHKLPATAGGSAHVRVARGPGRAGAPPSGSPSAKPLPGADGHGPAPGGCLAGEGWSPGRRARASVRAHRSSRPTRRRFCP